MRDPKVFLMDEPLSNLDAKLRVHMRKEIAKLHNELNATMIYVTHDQTEAMTLADRIVIMNAGVIQQIGTPFEVYNSPNNAFVASFMGSPAMNIVELTYQNGKVIDHNGLVLQVNKPMRDLLDKQGYDGKEILFGIRPEDIQTEQVALDASESILKPKVLVSELTGAESILYLDVFGTEYIAVVDSRDYHVAGSTLEVSFNMNKAHFFDKETGNVIK